MFSGQGSQYYHMGFELFQKQKNFQYWMRRLDHVASKAIGTSIIDILYDREKGNSDLFERILHTSPAIFMVEYSLAMVLIGSNIYPDIVLGASLGEFVAAAISEVMTPEEILIAVIQQAKTIEKECKNGGMLAILHEKNLYYDTPQINERSELSSINFHSHFVVSGTKENLEEIKSFLRDKGIIYQALPILYPFHSSLIDPAQQPYKSFLKHLKFKEPQIPIISCSSVGLLKRVENEHLWDVIRKPILFEDTIRDIETQGEHFYIDIGPSGTLANFVKYNLNKKSQSQSAMIISPFGQDIRNLEKITNLFQK